MVTSTFASASRTKKHSQNSRNVSHLWQKTHYTSMGMVFSKCLAIITNDCHQSAVNFTNDNIQWNNLYYVPHQGWESVCVWYMLGRNASMSVRMRNMQVWSVKMTCKSSLKILVCHYPINVFNREIYFDAHTIVLPFSFHPAINVPMKFTAIRNQKPNQKYSFHSHTHTHTHTFIDQILRPLKMSH